ncbi:MAG: pyridoxal phosphate-dependent aminotransferase [Planctomycetaceae bacterium]
MQLSNAIQRLQPSATIAAAAKARELKQSGVDVHEFTLGEPDFVTPDHICEAARQAMQDGHTHYTPATGIPELKAAICNAYERDHGLRYEPSQVAVSNGAKHSIHNVLTTLCNPGDEVIIPAPYWVSYSALVELAGATPVIVNTTQDSDFCLSPQQFEAAITNRTRLLMLNNPCNPTGCTYPITTLQALAEIAIERDLVVMSDEIYEKLLYQGAEFRSFSTLQTDLTERTVVVSGVSKAYAMTGWRIGWTLGPEAITKGMTKLQSQETSNPCSISQHAAIAALNGPQDCVVEMGRAFAERRDYVLERLQKLRDIGYAEPRGAFYAFLDVSAHFGRELPGGHVVTNSTDFCTCLLQEAHVAVVTGDAFGAPGYVRLSFATSRAVIEAGFDALETFLAG